MDGILHRLEPCDHRLCLHGHAVQVLCDVPSLNWPIHHAFGEFATPDWPDGFAPVAGHVAPYEQDVVMRHLSPHAVAVATDDLTEIYEHEGRFWVVDDRWGLAEINLLKGCWQSWVLPRPALATWQVAEAAVTWPMAQLLRQKGLALIPAASVATGGFGVLILSPFGIEPELTALVSAGWRVVGQRWTALREEDGRISMLRLPGRVERLTGLRYRSTGGEAGVAQQPTWVDLSQERPGSSAHHAFCDAVVVVDPARRATAGARAARGSGVTASIRKSWPMIDLHAGGGGAALHLPARLAAGCAVLEAQLSRRPGDFVAILEKLRLSHPVAPATPAKITATVRPAVQPTRPAPRRIPA